MSFAGKVAFITGGGGGLGRAFGHALAQEGARVVLVDVVATAAAEVAAELQQQGLDAVAFGCDITDEHQVEAVVQKVVEHLKSDGKPEYIGDVLEPSIEEGAAGPDGAPSGEKDPLYDQAVEVVVRTRRPSISLVQRHLRIGYNRAARLLEQMEKSGLVSSMSNSGNRELIVPNRET